MKLPNHDRVEQCIPDAMHTIKDVLEHVFHLITGREDSEKVRKAEIEIGRFQLSENEEETPVLHPKKRRVLPNCCFRLSSDDIKLANKRSSSVVLPSPDFTPGNIFTSTYGMKSHD